MISSRTLKLLLLGLALSLNAISASASFIVRPPAGVRARLLEDDNGNEDVQSPEEEPASQEPSQEENEEDEATASTEDPASADDGRSTRSAGIGPRARECTTREYKYCINALYANFTTF